MYVGVGVMDLLPLNFPVFYHCAVKGNTNLSQYNAVSVLLLGKLRDDCIDVIISDAEAAGYTSGKKRIKKDVLTQVTQISNEEARNRIEALKFQNYPRIANAVRELLTIVDIPVDIQQKVRQNTDNLAVIADTFIIAIKYPVKDILPLGDEEKVSIAHCYSVSSPMDKVEGGPPSDSYKPGIKEARKSVQEEPGILPASPVKDESGSSDDGQDDKLEYEIYRQYLETLVPLFITIEAQAASFPIELLNEIRGIFTHMAKYKVNGSVSDLRMAESHISTAVVDAYKYFCITVVDKYETIIKNQKKPFFKKTSVSNDLAQLAAISKSKLKEARQYEVEGTGNPVVVFRLFEEAFNLFCQLDNKMECSKTLDKRKKLWVLFRFGEKAPL